MQIDMKAKRRELISEGMETVKQFCQRVHVSEQAAYARAALGHIKIMKLGRNVLIYPGQALPEPIREVSARKRSAAALKALIDSDEDTCQTIASTLGITASACNKLVTRALCYCGIPAKKFYKLLKARSRTDPMDWMGYPPMEWVVYVESIQRANYGDIC